MGMKSIGAKVSSSILIGSKDWIGIVNLFLHDILAHWWVIFTARCYQAAFFITLLICTTLRSPMGSCACYMRLLLWHLSPTRLAVMLQMATRIFLTFTPHPYINGLPFLLAISIWSKKLNNISANTIHKIAS